MEELHGSVDDWLVSLASLPGEVGVLLAASPMDQDGGGYAHTIREICQQPITWIETASRVAGRVALFEDSLAAVNAEAAPGAIVLTGSGSSLYAGECLSLALQRALGIPVHPVSAGMVLTDPAGCLAHRVPSLMVSFARSGNSPESCGAVDAVRESMPLCRHLVITCSGQGRLATRYRDDPRVATVVLDERTNDRSLVMTSSFTNMVLAGRLLALTRDVAGYRARVSALARQAADMLLGPADALARVARSEFRTAVYLGSGNRHGAAREAALKMLEMTGGQVKTFPETYLGLRHGPMCAIDGGALVVCFLSSDPVTRAYEVDLVRELNQKKLGARKVLVGPGVPEDIVSAGDVVIDPPGLAAIADEDAPVLDVLVGQLLAFHRCLHIGLRPDAPSDEGVISRVVGDFAIHRRR
jgi:D-galactosamine 6-phosphate deaminase/isomerase